MAVLVGALAWSGCGGDEKRPGPAAEAPTATASPTRSPQPGASRPVRAWSLQAVHERLAGRRIAVGRRRVRLARATLTCSGVGRPSRSGGALAWSRFRCVQPTFPSGTVAGPDVVFTVVPTGRRSLVTEDARVTGY